MAWAKTQPNLAKASLKELCSKPEIRDMVYDAIFAQCKASKLKGSTSDFFFLFFFLSLSFFLSFL